MSGPALRRTGHHFECARKWFRHLADCDSWQRRIGLRVGSRLRRLHQRAHYACCCIARPSAAPAMAQRRKRSCLSTFPHPASFSSCAIRSSTECPRAFPPRLEIWKTDARPVSSVGHASEPPPHRPGAGSPGPRVALGEELHPVVQTFDQGHHGRAPGAYQDGCSCSSHSSPKSRADGHRSIPRVAIFSSTRAGRPVDLEPPRICLGGSLGLCPSAVTERSPAW